MLRPLLALIPILVISSPSSAQLAAMPTVAIAESNFRIAPNVIHLIAGQPVRLAFTNLSGSGHDFSAPEFFAHARIVSGQVEGGEIDVPRHGQASVVVIPDKGTYRAHCTHFGHTMFGMKATIVVD